MSRFKYPVDTDQFQRIREDGKVLLCNTFKAYFQGKKELFEGLKVIDEQKYE